MKAREFTEACITFQQFGKIKDIDFDLELCYELIDGGNEVYFRYINFEAGTVTIGTLESFGCECCGSYLDETILGLDELASRGYLGKVIDMLDWVLDKKGIGC